MATRPRHAERARPRGDLFDLEDAERSVIVQMDIDADATFVRDAEDDIEMLFDIAIEARGIEAADEIGAHGDRFIEQVRRAGALQDAALRKRDELDIDDIAIGLAHRKDLFQRSEPDGAVHRDMAAHLG